MLSSWDKDFIVMIITITIIITVELQWLEHLWVYENLFETGVVRAIKGLL